MALQIRGNFKPLTEDQLTAIVDIQLKRLEQRLQERRLTLVVTAGARKLLAQRGWDAVYGARPLKRAIQRLVQDPLAMMLLEGKFSDSDTVTVDVKGGELTFTRAASAAPAAVAAGGEETLLTDRAGGGQREVDQVGVLGRDRAWVVT